MEQWAVILTMCVKHFTYVYVVWNILVYQNVVWFDCECFWFILQKAGAKRCLWEGQLAQNWGCQPRTSLQHQWKTVHLRHRRRCCPLVVRHRRHQWDLSWMRRQCRLHLCRILQETTWTANMVIYILIQKLHRSIVWPAFLSHVGSFIIILKSATCRLLES